MKIAILDFDDIRNPLLAAGQAVATFEVAKILAKKGHQITVISSKFPGSKDRLEEGIYYKHIALGSSNIRLNNLFYILSIPFAVKKLEADIIIECFTAPISTLFTPLWTKIPVVAIPTSFQAKSFSDKYHLPFDIIENFGVRLYKYFLPYSNYLDRKMKKINPNIISRIVPEGVANSYFHVKKMKSTHILFLGRLDIYQKGLDLLLIAYKQISDKIKYPLCIAGIGPDEMLIKKQIRKLKLSRKVKLLGSTYGSKKMRILAKSLFVVIPSRYEGFCCFALEAFASGIPLVCFDIPGLSWIDQKCAIKIKGFDTEKFSESILNLSISKKIDIMGNSARKFAAGFTWEKVADQYEKFFEFIIQNHQI